MTQEKTAMGNTNKNRSSVITNGICSVTYFDFIYRAQTLGRSRYEALDLSKSNTGWGDTAPLSWNVRAAMDGIVSYIDGCNIYIYHGNGWKTTYAHLDNIQVSLSYIYVFCPIFNCIPSIQTNTKKNQKKKKNFLNFLKHKIFLHSSHTHTHTHTKKNFNA